MKIKISTAKSPLATGPFSQAVVNENIIFTSGQIYLTTEGKLLEGSTEDQVHQIMKNLQFILEEAGVSFKDVMKTTIYVTDMSIYGKVNEAYATYMSDPFPAREVVCVKELPLGAQIEISMMAIKP
jgi:2-iminobutanoate/2-iminopropanoate deaminase